MGYLTKYELKTKKQKNDIKKVLEEICKESDAHEAINMVGETLQPTKWYNHEDELKSVSLKFPNVTFVLLGEGEDFGDIWEKEFKDGVMIAYNSTFK